MPKIQMEVIPEPKAGTAAVLRSEGPRHLMANPYAVIHGTGDTDYLCGACRVVIAAKMERGQLINLVLKCAKCNSFNIVRGT